MKPAPYCPSSKKVVTGFFLDPSKKPSKQECTNSGGARQSDAKRREERTEARTSYCPVRRCLRGTRVLPRVREGRRLSRSRGLCRRIRKGEQRYHRWREGETPTGVGVFTPGTVRLFRMVDKALHDDVAGAGCGGGVTGSPW